MRIFFTDKNFSIKLEVSEETKNFSLIDDKTTFSLETGSSTFECTIATNTGDHKILKNIQPGQFIFIDSIQIEYTYDLYQIVNVEYDVLQHTLQVYAESAGLELLGSIAGAYTSENPVTLTQIVQNFLPAYWEVNLLDVDNSSKSVSWESEVSTTERLLDIAKKWDARVFYTFSIKNWVLTAKIANFCKVSSERTPIQIDLNLVTNLTISKSIEDFCTALRPTGATPDSVSDNKTAPPIDLKNFSYSYTDPENGDYYYVNTSTGVLINRTQRHKFSGPLNESGLITRPYSYDTLSKEMLAGQARAALQKISHPREIYTLSLKDITHRITIDDYISLIVPKEDISLIAKVVRIEKSSTQNFNQIQVEVLNS